MVNLVCCSLKTWHKFPICTYNLCVPIAIMEYKCLQIKIHMLGNLPWFMMTFNDLPTDTCSCQYKLGYFTNAICVRI